MTSLSCLSAVDPAVRMALTLSGGRKYLHGYSVKLISNDAFKYSLQQNSCQVILPEIYIIAPSNLSKALFFSSPPAYPVRLPLEPITR